MCSNLKKNKLETRFSEPGAFQDWLRIRQEMVNPQRHKRVGKKISDCENNIRRQQFELMHKDIHRGSGNEKKTHCAKGHAYSLENTLYVKVKDKIWRHCRACQMISQAKRVRKF